MPRKKAGGDAPTPKLTTIEGGKSKTPKAPRAPKAKAPPKNMEALSDENRQALHLHHSDKIAGLVLAKDASVAAIRNARKIAKADLGESGLKDIDVALKLRKPGGEVELRQMADRIIRVAQWNGADVGQQLTLLDTIVPRDWYEEGKRSGIRGEALRFPDGLSQKDAQTYGRGHESGKQSLIDAFGSTQPLADKARGELAAAHRGPAPAPSDDDGDLRGVEQRRAEKERATGIPVAADELSSEEAESRELEGSDDDGPAIGTEPPTHRTKRTKLN